MRPQFINACKWPLILCVDIENHVELARGLANRIILSGIPDLCSALLDREDRKWVVEYTEWPVGSIWTSPDSFCSVEKRNILISYMPG